MKTSAAQSFFNSVLGNTGPGYQELGALLQMLPYPAVLVERSQSRIVTANSEFLKLTAFSQAELENQPVTTLFDSQDTLPLKPGYERLCMVRKSNRPGQRMSMRVVALDPDNHWHVYQFEKVSQDQLTTELRKERTYHLLRELIVIEQEADLDAALTRALQVARDLFHTRDICVYHALSDEPKLRKLFPFESVTGFPDELPSTDLIRLREPQVWTPGKRVMTEIHRVGRVENFTYIATAPLGQNPGYFGLLAVGSTSDAPEEEIDSLVTLAAAQITNIFQRFLLTNNLRNSLEDRERELIVRSTSFSNAEEGIILVDPDLKILEMNPAAEWMLGYANWEVVGQMADNILISPDRIMPAIQTALQGVSIHSIGATSLHRRSGQSFPVKIQTVPVIKDDVVIALAIFFHDISEHEQIQARTQQLEHRALLGDVMAVFAHEVRNPINNISTGLQLMASMAEPEDPNQDVINRIQGDCTRLNHLMESVLAFSRPMEQRFEPMDVGQLLQRILDRWRPRFLKVNVKPYFQQEENIPNILGETRSLEQVFTNLISNAVEAMSKNGGTLAVRVAHAEPEGGRQQVEISITDNGPGIPDEIREHIFEPFITSKVTGTGLGLAITKRIVVAHRGSIFLTTFPGGTVFHVVLPAALEGE